MNCPTYIICHEINPGKNEYIPYSDYDIGLFSYEANRLSHRHSILFLNRCSGITRVTISDDFYPKGSKTF